MPEVRQDLFPEEKARQFFEKAKNEINWKRPSLRGNTVPRDVSVQGRLQDGFLPLYRHPVDEIMDTVPFQDFVEEIRDGLAAALNQDFNHVLIQYYRDGNDYISEHSDKTLDILHGSTIVNFTLGATRTMLLRSKQVVVGQPRQATRYRLSHNSVFVLTYQDNRDLYHSINRDKRDANHKAPDELAFDGQRISFTFRSVATFISIPPSLSHDGSRGLRRIYGQGATKKTRDAPAAISLKRADWEALLYAFSEENKSSDFDWSASYGAGFDCLDSASCIELV
ncbi:hypothetical protein HDU91_004472 [Kappamyces sp. JEL0680]|nr:hypothetical protein HDU91_004472 [Kappamyces sp. JEL0680]